MTVQKSTTRISPLSWNRDVIRKGSVAQSCPTLWDPMDCIAHQPPLSMEFSRQEYQNGLSFPPPGKLPNPGIEPGSPSLQADALPSEPPGNNSSATQSCPALCSPMNYSTPGFPVHHQRLELAQTHVHRVGDAIQPSYPLSSPSPAVRLKRLALT